MNVTTALTTDRANARNALLAGFLGWTLDAFDFFILTYVITQIGTEFHRSMLDMTLTLTASLVMRPVGAFIFGLMADRYGRRLPLMIDVLFYSGIEVLTGFAPNYTIFLILRFLYGIGMGGEWGVGASLAMEAAPPKWRGVLSGILQEGYAFGNLLAAIAFWTIFPHWGWRAMFFLGGFPALLVLFIRARVKESDAWRANATAKHDWRAYFRDVTSNWKRFLYLVVFLTMMNFISHGTQDLYPAFLQRGLHFSTGTTAVISAISMVGAMAGGVLFGLYSDRSGRRRAMVVAVLLAALLIPLWLFAPQLIPLGSTGEEIALVSIGAFFIQLMVQGAWGVVPAHINELSPGALRGFFPGFAYHVGVLLAAGAAPVEALLGHYFTLAQSMGMFAATAFILCAIVTAAGPEAHRISFAPKVEA